MEAKCPQCGWSKEVPERARGKKGKCPQCGGIFHIGSAESEDKGERFNNADKATKTDNSQPDEKKTTAQKKWFYRIGGNVWGPCSTGYLSKLLSQHMVDEHTQVSHTDSDYGWKEIKNIPELSVSHSEKTTPAFWGGSEEERSRTLASRSRQEDKSIVRINAHMIFFVCAGLALCCGYWFGVLMRPTSREVVARRKKGEAFRKLARAEDELAETKRHIRELRSEIEERKVQIRQVE